MKNIKKVPQDKTLIYIIPAVTTLTYFLISTFLSGKIIEIPHGTTKGAIISGIGVIVITIIMIAVGVGANMLIIRRNKKG
jgi:hypothetical protein